MPMIKLQVTEAPNVSDQIAFCAFHSFLHVIFHCRPLLGA